MASNSILKLQVDDKQYEASLKSAQQGLQALMNALRNSGKSFSDLDKNTAQYVRALGNMEATAKTTRGRIGEMSSAFVELSQVEKQLTDQERQSPVGKALTESLNQLKQRTIEAKQELADLDKQLTNQKAPATTGGIFSGLGSKMEGALAVFGGNLMTKAAGMGVGLVTEMTDAVKQGIELANAGEGIRIAFERLGRGDILDGLREATHGTVTDLELMKAAVKFNDFKLPIEELGTMLAFAQQKAKDTGQSVDYMVDSIVTGLGRKSLMILDNLGLSATEIRERMKETGDMTKAVGDIIREQMSKAGDYVETAADRAAQANVSLQNKMEELGRKFAPLEEASNSLWTSMKIGILDVVGGPLARLLNGLTEAGRMMNAYGKMGGNAKVGRMTANLAGASEGKRQSIYQQQQEQFWRYINPREQQIKDIRAWQSGDRNEALQKRIGAITEKYGSLDATKIQAEVDAAKKMLADYQSAAKQILQPIKQEITPTITTSGGTTPTMSTKSGNTVSIEDKMAQMWEQAFMKSVSISDSFVNPNESETSEIWKALSQESEVALSPLQKLREELAYLTKSLDEAADPQAYQDIKKVIEGKQRQIDDFTGETKKTKSTDKTVDELAKIGGDISKVTNSVGSIFSGLQQMGIEIPNEIQSVIGVVNGISTILIGISTLLTLIDAKQDAQLIADIIPFARGGVVPHAATGYFVGGNRRSGDTTHIMANAGELVLNESSQNSLAADILQARGLIESIDRLYGIGNPMLSMQTQSALGGQMRDGGLSTLKLEAYVKGEQLHLVHNRFLRRSGQGELVTWR